MDDTFRSRYANEVIVPCSTGGTTLMACEAEEKEGGEAAVGNRSKEMKGAKMKFVPFSFIIASFFGEAGIGGRGRGVSISPWYG